MTLNAAGQVRDAIVIAASAGGLQPLAYLLGAMPPDLPAAIAIVFHRSPLADGLLALLKRRSTLPLTEPESGTVFLRGEAYLAPRDHHLLLEDGIFRLDRGPALHSLRPAADVLFTTAAAAYGPRVAGIVLSGAGFDGARGAMAIKAAGGVVLVQAPDEAVFPWMPRYAIHFDHVDATLPLNGIAAAIPRLAAGEAVST